MSVVSASEVVGYTTGISLDSVVVVAELLVWVRADDVVVVADFQAEVVAVAALEWETEKTGWTSIETDGHDSGSDHSLTVVWEEAVKTAALKGKKNQRLNVIAVDEGDNWESLVLLFWWHGLAGKGSCSTGGVGGGEEKFVWCDCSMVGLWEVSIVSVLI